LRIRDSIRGRNQMTRAGQIWLSSAFGLCVLFAPAHPAAELSLRTLQEDKAKASGQLVYEIDVAVTNIEVFVRRKDGRWLTGLKPEDFEVYEDGVLQKITHFREANPLRAKAVGLPRDGAIPQKSQPGSPAVEPLPNKIIFFFDNEHLQPSNRNWIINKLKAFIRDNFDGQRANQGMVVFLDKNLEIVQNFTPFASSLLQAVEDVAKRSGDALMRMRSWEDLQQELDDLVSSASGADSYEQARQSIVFARGYVEEEMNQVHFSLRSLTSLANYLNGIKGRKILIYISDRLPLNPGEEIFSYIGQASNAGNARLEAMNYDASWLFKEFVAKSNANEIAVYSIHASIFDAGFASADKAQKSSVTVSGLYPLLPGAAPQNDGMDMMARETGGRSVLARQDIAGGLKQIEDDLVYFYSLGYTSHSAADNAYHPIDVRIKNMDPGTEIRFRQGYLKSSAGELIKDNVVSRLFLPQKDNPLGIQVQILPLEKRPFEQTRLTLKILIPINRLELERTNAERVGKIKVVVALLDSKNFLSDPHELVHEIRIPEREWELARGRVYPYLAELMVAPERYVISLAVKDLMGSAASYLQFFKEVPK
jgi:VWFA-related protein